MVKNSIFWLLPKNFLSNLMGIWASLKLPKWFLNLEIRFFAYHFKVNWDEVAEPINHFDSLQSFFIRRLKEGCRRIDPNEKALVSPCDGVFGQSGYVENGMLLQIKGKAYSLSSLLGGDRLVKKFEGGSYATFYLSPKDYHRFHAPSSFYLKETIHLPGHLWPVNPWAVANVDQLFCVNERMVLVFNDNNSFEPCAVMVLVGAMMVGKIQLNSYLPQEKIFKGAELGHFEFGSTIVLITASDFASIKSEAFGFEVQVGQCIGTI